MSSYIVKQGETIGDVVLNATGSLSNWDAILEANGAKSWIPDLVAGMVMKIPDASPIDPNTKRQLAGYPACNASINDVYQKIGNVFDTINNNWILATGFWRDPAVWIDTKNWID